MKFSQIVAVAVTTSLADAVGLEMFRVDYYPDEIKYCMDWPSFNSSRCETDEMRRKCQLAWDLLNASQQSWC